MLDFDRSRRDALGRSAAALATLVLPLRARAASEKLLALALSREFGFPIAFDLPDDEARDLLAGMIVKRGNAADPGDPRILMDTVAGLAYFPFAQTGTARVRFDLAAEQVLPITRAADTPRDDGASVAASVMVQADWLTAEAQRQRGGGPVAGANANVFGGVGVLTVPEGFRIPVVLATADNVRHYGMTLIAQGEVFTFGAEMDALFMTYRYDADYRRDFVLQQEGGGGFFVETHAFPHIHAPLRRDCGGFITIGRDHGAGRFEFTAFRIPYGRALYIPGHTIHGDSTLVGEYGITVAHTHADTVVIHQGGAMALDIFDAG